MKRFRLAAWATLVGLGLTSGCSTFGCNGYSGNGFFSRLFHRNAACDVGCPCDMGCGPTCDGGPMVMDPWAGGVPPVAGGPPPGAPGGLAPEAGVPPLAPPPRVAPQAQPFSAGPVGRAK